MDILFIVLANLITLGIIIFEVIRGKNNGFFLQLFKTIFVGGAAVGLYFLTPILGKLLMNISYVSSLVNTNALLNSIFIAALFFILYLIVYILIDLLFKFFKSLSERGIKPYKDKSVVISKDDLKTYKTNKKNELKLFKEALKEKRKEYRRNHKISCGLGMIFGLVSALCTITIIFFALKPVLYHFDQNKAYDYTLPGIIDTSFDYSDKVEDKLTEGSGIVDLEAPTPEVDNIIEPEIEDETITPEQEIPEIADETIVE